MIRALGVLALVGLALVVLAPGVVALVVQALVVLAPVVLALVGQFFVFWTWLSSFDSLRMRQHQ